MQGDVPLDANPICRGFAWSQPFTFAAGFLMPGDAIEATFRQFPGINPASQPVIVRDGDTVTLTFDEAATAAIDPSVMRADMVLKPANSPAIPLMVRLIVVVLTLTTDADQ